MAERHILFYKPYGVLSQFSNDKTSHPTLKQFIDVPDVYPAGRLDHDSEGLLLLTSDGALQHRLTDPRHAHPRTYWAQVEGDVTEEALAQLRRGVAVQDYVTRPAHAVRLTEEPPLPPRDPPIRYRKLTPTSWVELTLTEGRNRQVRRMTAAVGFPTLRLIRARIGQLSLQGLQPGEWREVGRSEVEKTLAPARGHKGSRTSTQGPIPRGFATPGRRPRR